MSQLNLFDLSGRVAVITGGGGLLASEHAIALSAHGAKIILADFQLDKCKETAEVLAKDGVEVKAMFCDVTKKESWQKLLEDVMAEFGKVDILINNAGFTNQSKSANFDASFENFPLKDWNAIMNVNLTGTFLGCQVIGKHMVENNKGSIINLSLIYGFDGTNCCKSKINCNLLFLGRAFVPASLLCNYF